MQKKIDVEGKVVDYDLVEEVETMNIQRWQTTSFEIVLKHKHGQETAIDKFLNRLEVKNKLGGYKIPSEEWDGRKQGFIAKRMKPLGARPTGNEFEESFKVFLNAIFSEGQAKKD